MSAAVSTWWPVQESTAEQELTAVRRERDELAATVARLRAEAAAREGFMAMVVNELGAPISVVSAMAEILSVTAMALLGRSSMICSAAPDLRGSDPG